MSLALWLCSSLIIALLLRTACARSWALLQPLVCLPPATRGESGYEEHTFGWGHWTKATAKLPISACIKKGGRHPWCQPGHPHSTGYDPCVATAPQPSSGS